jgi:hypothetical protein
MPRQAGHLFEAPFHVAHFAELFMEIIFTRVGDDKGV